MSSDFWPLDSMFMIYKHYTFFRKFTCMVMGLGMREYVSWCHHYVLTKVLHFFWLNKLSASLCLVDCLILIMCMHGWIIGKIAVVDIGNNNINSEGLRPVAEFIKKTKSLLWFSLYMNDISDEVLLLLVLFSLYMIPMTKSIGWSTYGHMINSRSITI